MNRLCDRCGVRPCSVRIFVCGAEGIQILALCIEDCRGDGLARIKQTPEPLDKSDLMSRFAAIFADQF